MWITDCKIRTPFSKYFSNFYFCISSKFKNTVNFYNLIGSSYITIIVCCVFGPAPGWNHFRHFSMFFPFFLSKMEKKKKKCKKHAFSPGVDQLLGVNRHLRVTTKRWKIPFFMHVFLFIFWAFSSFFVCDRKRQKNMF